MIIMPLFEQVIYPVCVSRILAYLEGIFSLNWQVLEFIGQKCLDLLSHRELPPET